MMNQRCRNATSVAVDSSNSSIAIVSDWFQWCCKALGCCGIDKREHDDENLFFPIVETSADTKPQYRLQTAGKLY